jgi:hypothetical protein
MAQAPVSQLQSPEFKPLYSKKMCVYVCMCVCVTEENIDEYVLTLR